jgi:hypothetical protein
LRRIASFAAALVLAGSVGTASAATFNDLASFLAATGPLQFVDFNVGPPNTDILNTYAGQGVTFTPGNFFADCVQVTSPTGCWINNSSDNANGRLFDAQFIVGGVTAVGLNAALNGSLSILRAFDAADNLLEQVSSDADSQTLDFFGLTTTTPIAYITVQFPAPVFGWAVDDLRFGAAADTAIPEPATLLLLGSGLFMARRARKSRG